MRVLPTVQEIAGWLDPLAFEKDPKDCMSRRRSAAFEQARVVHRNLLRRMAQAQLDKYLR